MTLRQKLHRPRTSKTRSHEYAYSVNLCRYYQICHGRNFSGISEEKIRRSAHHASPRRTRGRMPRHRNSRSRENPTRSHGAYRRMGYSSYSRCLSWQKLARSEEIILKSPRNPNKRSLIIAGSNLSFNLERPCIWLSKWHLNSCTKNSHRSLF